MTILETTYSFNQSKFKLSLFNWSDSVCTDWSTTLCRFRLLEGAQQMFSFTSSSRVSSWRRCPLCPLLCSGGWNKLLFAYYQKIVHFWQQFCHWIGNRKVYTDSLRIGSWNRMNQIFVASLYCLLLVENDCLNWVFLTHNVIFKCVCGNQETVFWIICMKAGNPL